MNNGFDEREQKNAGKAAGWVVMVTYIYLIIESFYKFLKTKEISNCTWEIGLICLITVVILVVAKTNEEIILPKTISGRKLPTGNTIEEKRIRSKHYILDSVIFSVSMVFISGLTYFTSDIPLVFINIMNGGSKEINFVIGALIEILVLFFISVIIDHLWGEHLVKKYNSQCEQYEDEL